MAAFAFISQLMLAVTQMSISLQQLGGKPAAISCRRRAVHSYAQKKALSLQRLNETSVPTVLNADVLSPPAVLLA